MEHTAHPPRALVKLVELVSTAGLRPVVEKSDLAHSLRTDRNESAHAEITAILRIERCERA